MDGPGWAWVLGLRGLRGLGFRVCEVTGLEPLTQNPEPRITKQQVEYLSLKLRFENKKHQIVVSMTSRLILLGMTEKQHILPTRQASKHR